MVAISQLIVPEFERFQTFVGPIEDLDNRVAHQRYLSLEGCSLSLKQVASSTLAIGLYNIIFLFAST